MNRIPKKLPASRFVRSTVAKIAPKVEPPAPVGPSYGAQGKMITTRLDATELARVDAIAKAITQDHNHYHYGYGKIGRAHV